MPEEKKKVGLLIGLGPVKARSGDDGDGKSPASLAAKGVLQAVEDGDASALEDALRTFYDACESEKSAPADDEEE